VADNQEHGVLQAGEQLKDFIQMGKDDSDEKATSLKNADSKMKTRRPLVILAFDKAHILTELMPNRSWSIYSELCRCLSHLISLPIFTLFLSTAGKFRHFYPGREWEISTRVAQGLKLVLPPITETGFDQFALPVQPGQTTLYHVTQDEWIYRLGRPLYVFLTSAF